MEEEIFRRSKEKTHIDSRSDSKKDPIKEIINRKKCIKIEFWCVQHRLQAMGPLLFWANGDFNSIHSTAANRTFGFIHSVSVQNGSFARNIILRKSE